MTPHGRETVQKSESGGVEGWRPVIKTPEAQAVAERSAGSSARNYKPQENSAISVKPDKPTQLAGRPSRLCRGSPQESGTSDWHFFEYNASDANVPAWCQASLPSGPDSCTWPSLDDGPNPPTCAGTQARFGEASGIAVVKAGNVSAGCSTRRIISNCSP